MRWRERGDQECSVARTVSVIGDHWTLLVLRECFLRVRRFEGFQERLGIPRPLLAARLQKLVGAGVLAKVAYRQRPARQEYRLTPKGLDLYPVRMAIVHWGDVPMTPDGRRPLLHRHRSCGHRFDRVMVCSECAAPPGRARGGSGAGFAGRRGRARRGGRSDGAAAEAPSPASRDRPARLTFAVSPGRCRSTQFAQSNFAPGGLRGRGLHLPVAAALQADRASACVATSKVRFPPRLCENTEP
jgi:DNA-binding HxlR family transcriptional regulator